MWINDRPSHPNLVPFASEMCDWTSRRRKDLSTCSEGDRQLIGSYTNPFTYHASAIQVALADIINSAFEFSESAQPISPLDAEVRRVRLHNELVLYVARFCEATIKQMLFCTQIPKKVYAGASLGRLLAMECASCKASGKRRHDISLLGALAHQYFLCHTLDACAFTHLQLVNRRRNLEAAHSESQVLNLRDATQSRAHLATVLKEAGHELGHMADHIGQIERAMIAETELYIAHGLNTPPIDALMRIPARPPSDHPARRTETRD